MVKGQRVLVVGLLVVSVLALMMPSGAAAHRPTAPQYVTVEAGPSLIGEATVSWEPPVFDGGSPITHYVVWAVDGSHEWQIARVDASRTSVVLRTEWPMPGWEEIAVSAVNEVGDSPHAYGCLVWSPYGAGDGTLWCR